MTTQNSTPHIILVPGHWLGSWAWDEVREHLSEREYESTALTLPGLDEADPERAQRTLEEQAVAIEKVILAQEQPVVLVAHSGGNAPVSIALDRHPDRIQRVVWADSGPAASGMVFAPDFPDHTDGLPLPPFNELKAQASFEGLTDAMLARFRERAVAEPGPVLREAVTLTNEQRFAVPSTFICSSMSSAQIQELVKVGHPMFAEVANYTSVEYIDLPTGHWPMWSRAGELAEGILAAVRA